MTAFVATYINKEFWTGLPAVVNEFSCRCEHTHENESATICEHEEHWKTRGADESVVGGGSVLSTSIISVVIFLIVTRIDNFENRLFESQLW